MKKILCALLMLCLTLPTFAACSENGQGNITDTSNVETTDTGEPEIPAEVLDIIKDKKTSYVICRPDKADKDGALVGACRELSDAFFTATGAFLPLANDWFYDRSDIPEYEILVGANDRDETRSVSDGLLYSNYVIRYRRRKR